MTGIVEAYMKDKKNMKEIKQLWQQFTQTRDILNTIIDHMPFPFWIKDTKGHYILTNREYENQFGFSQKDVQGKTDFLIWDEEAANQYRYNDNEVIETGESIFTKETVKDSRTNTISTWYVLKFPFKNTKGEVVEVGGFGLRLDKLRDKGVIEECCQDE